MQHFVSWLDDLAGPIPELPSVWEFLSGTGYEIECRIVDYQSQMEEQGFAREQIDRRMEIVHSFHKLCEELGYIRDDE